jgi:hypothetical protein
MSINTLLRPNDLTIYAANIIAPPNPEEIAFSGINPGNSNQLVIKALSLGTDPGSNILYLTDQGLSYGAYQPGNPPTFTKFNGNTIIFDNTGAKFDSTNGITLETTDGIAINGLRARISDAADNSNLYINTISNEVSQQNSSLGFLLQQTNATVVGAAVAPAAPTKIVEYKTIANGGFNNGGFMPNLVNGFIVVPAGLSGIYQINASYRISNSNAAINAYQVVLGFYLNGDGTPIVATDITLRNTNAQTITLSSTVVLVAASTYYFGAVVTSPAGVTGTTFFGDVTSSFISLKKIS